jgi:predicted RNA-binding Zn-ribbon protein involved in translation (DUF1610 family)
MNNPTPNVSGLAIPVDTATVYYCAICGEEMAFGRASSGAKIGGIHHIYVMCGRTPGCAQQGVKYRLPVVQLRPENYDVRPAGFREGF